MPLSRARRKRSYTRKTRAEEGQKGGKKLNAEGKGRIKNVESSDLRREGEAREEAEDETLRER